jgi:hypothetical protein
MAVGAPDDRGITAWAMSQENVEIVRTVMAGFNRRDVETFSAYLGEDAEMLRVWSAM